VKFSEIIEQTVGILITLVLLVVTWRHHRQIEDLIDNISEES